MKRFPALIGAVVVLTLAAGPEGPNAQMRGDVEDGVDRFALAHFDKIQPKSIRENRAYCGLIGFDSEGILKATPAEPGTGRSCQPTPVPTGFEILATYRTLGAFGGMTGGELPAAAHLETDFAQRLDGYVATPGGRVWLNLASERLTYQVCGRGCVPSDAAAHPCKKFAPKVEYTVLQLRQIEAKAPDPC